MRRVLLACAAMVLLGGSACPARPVAAVRLVSFGGGMPVDYGGSRVHRTYAIYGGTAAGDVGIVTTRSGMSAASPLVIRDRNGAVVRTLATDNTDPTEAAVRVPGNVAFVEANWDGNGTAPSATIASVDITTMRDVNFPPRDGAFELQRNTPLELFFSAADRSTYFVTVRGVAGKRIDVVLDGPGRAHVSDTERVLVDAESGQPLEGSRVLEVVDATRGGVATFAPEDGIGDVLHLTVSNIATGDAGHARLSVNEVRDIVPLRIWFNTAGPFPFNGDTSATIRAAMPATLNETSKALYQATGGRVRLGAVEVLLANRPPSSPPKTDVRVDGQPSGPVRSHVFGFQDWPLVSIELLMDWYTAPANTRGAILAHELMHYRYRLPDEYREPLPLEMQLTPPGSCAWCRCPGSMMTVLGDELCWSGNHNPFDDPFLAARTTTPEVVNGSMWRFLAPQLGVAPPSSSPVRILRGSTFGGGSAVTFP